MMPLLPIPADAIAFTEHEVERLAAYRKKIDELQREMDTLKVALIDISLTAIGRAGGDTTKEWRLSADLRCALPKV